MPGHGIVLSQFNALYMDIRFIYQNYAILPYDTSSHLFLLLFLIPKAQSSTRYTPPSILMRLLRNPPLHPRRNRIITLQTPPSTLRLRLRCIFLQLIHCNAITQGRFIRCVEENPIKKPP